MSRVRLELLCGDKLLLDDATMEAALRAYHADISLATVEADGQENFLIRWQRHAVAAIPHNHRNEDAAIDQAVEFAHYDPELKQLARAHVAYLELVYQGDEDDVLEQYVATATVAGALAGFGGIVVTNRQAGASLPAAALANPGDGTDMLEILYHLPVPILYCGFVKYEREAEPGLWISTVAAHRLGLPDLAARAEGHDEAEFFFDLFSEIYSYLLRTGARLNAGDTMEMPDGMKITLARPGAEWQFLSHEGILLIVEIPDALGG